MHIKNILVILLVLSLFACKRDVATLLPGPPDASVNFYNASEVLNTVDSLRRNNYVFIDDSTKKYPPKFDENAKDMREYPHLTGTSQPGGSYTLVDYMRLSAGDHRLMFTGGNAIALLKDTTLSFQRSTYTCLYLVESKSNDSAYRLVVAPEDRKSPAAGKLRIRIINLCPDVDTFKCFRRDKAGNVVKDGMPQDMLPGAVTSYMEVDTSAAIHQKVFISFFTGNSQDNPQITTGVPATEGRSFTVIIQGFKSDKMRRMFTRLKADGSPEYRNVYVTANLRTNIRATY